VNLNKYKESVLLSEFRSWSSEIATHVRAHLRVHVAHLRVHVSHLRVHVSHLRVHAELLHAHLRLHHHGLLVGRKVEVFHRHSSVSAHHAEVIGDLLILSLVLFILVSVLGTHMHIYTGLSQKEGAKLLII
jgi:hypothetical protein